MFDDDDDFMLDPDDDIDKAGSDTDDKMDSQTKVARPLLSDDDDAGKTEI